MVALTKEGARLELARDRLASLDKGGIETLGDAFLDFHLREKDGILEPIRDARPPKGDASAHCRFAIGFGV